MVPMKFGLWTVNMGDWAEPAKASALVRTAEDCGFESVWTGDHIVVPRGYTSDYPVDGGGPMPFPDDHVFADSLVFLAWLASQTTRIRLCTGVLVLPERNAVAMAKEISTLDYLSGGRVTVGVGIGWMREEYEALGVPFSRRGARLDESINVLRTLWKSTSASHDGDFYSFSRLCCSPRPIRCGGPPIVISGNSHAAARRAGRIGNGWLPMGQSRECLAEGLEVMRAAASDAGRDAAAIEVTHGVFPADPFSDKFIEELIDYRRLGVHRVILPPMTDQARDIASRFDQFATDIMSNPKLHITAQGA